MAFGQGTTAVTPIAMADAYATFANGGTRYAPEVAAAVVNPHGKVIIRYAPHVTGHVSLPPSIRDPILQGLTGVVDSPDGTAYPAFHTYFHHSLASFPIAGKTGTASNAPLEEPNSWFVGFGPTTHPQYVVLCVIDEGGYGADASAPVVAKTFNYLYSHPVPALKLNAALTTPVKRKKSPHHNHHHDHVPQGHRDHHDHDHGAQEVDHHHDGAQEVAAHHHHHIVRPRRPRPRPPPRFPKGGRTAVQGFQCFKKVKRGIVVH